MVALDITFDQKFQYGEQMTACKQIRVLSVVVECFIDLGLRRIQCCTVHHGSEVMVLSVFVMSHALYVYVVFIITPCSHVCVICVFFAYMQCRDGQTFSMYEPHIFKAKL